MSFTRRRSVAAGVSVAALLSASVAVASTVQSYQQSFTSKHPGKQAGMKFSAKAVDPTGAAVKQARTVTLTFPAGTKIDPGAVAKCKTAPSCPSKSRVGTGKATVLGLSISVTAYNRAGGMVLVVSNPVGNPIVLKPALQGSRLVVSLPQMTFQGNPLTITQLTLTIKPAGTAKRPYVRTPATCPKAGKWMFTGKFVYADRSSVTLKSYSPCVKR